MFWGLVLEPYKKYTQKVDQTFHISQAALDLDSCNSHPVKLVLEYENSDFVLATLSKTHNIFQVPLDLIFKTGDEISFRTIGGGKVHLSGYHVLDDLDNMIMNGEEESDVEEAEDIIVRKGKRMKLTQGVKIGKKARLDDPNEDESENDDDDDDSDEENEGLDDDNGSEEEDEQITATGKKANKKKQKNDSSLLSMDDDDDDDDDDDNDDEDEEDEDDDLDDLDDDDEDEADSDEMEEDAESPKLDSTRKIKKAKNKAPQTPNGLTPDSKGKNQSAQKLNKNLKQGTSGKEIKTPKSETKQKEEKNSGSAESTPQKKNPESVKKEAKTPKSPKNEGSPQKRVLEGGVISEEIKVGTGPVAKPGKMVNVYYVGILASTKKEFDSVQTGVGFKFRLGRNEVIKGWDIGLIGMKVGGKRRLTIPPHLAYGSKGSSPVIPPNSTLIFTVELKGIS